MSGFFSASTPCAGGTEYYQYMSDNKRVVTYGPNGLPTVFIYGAFGEKVATVNGGFYNNVYFAGRLIVRDAPAGFPRGSYFVFVDRLGSVGNFMPYGEEISATADGTMKFATYSRSAATGLDYADQRYYTSTFGRFMSADRSARAAKANDSGSWNKYSYVGGDPVNKYGPTGKIAYCPPGTYSSLDATSCVRDDGGGNQNIATKYDYDTDQQRGGSRPSPQDRFLNLEWATADSVMLRVQNAARRAFLHPRSRSTLAPLSASGTTRNRCSRVRRQLAVVVQHHVQLDCALGPAVLGPVEHVHRRVDNAAVQAHLYQVIESPGLTEYPEVFALTNPAVAWLLRGPVNPMEGTWTLIR